MFKSSQSVFLTEINLTDNIFFSESPGSAKSHRRRESTPVMTATTSAEEKVFQRSATSVQLNLPSASPTVDVATANEVTKRHGVTKLVKEFEKFATIRSKHFNKSESPTEETDGLISSRSKNIFLKNRRKISGTVPKNLQYMKQSSVVESPVYRRQRRPGIHVETSHSTEV